MSVRPLSLRLFWPRCPGAPMRSGFQTYFSPSTRSFATGMPRFASAPKPARPAPRPHQYKPRQPEARIPPPGGIGPLAMKVAQAPEAYVTLYKTSSHRTFLLHAYSLSAFCFAYAIYNTYDVFTDPRGERPRWQKVMFGGICVAMSGFGTVLLARTKNLVRTITAIRSNGQLKIRFAVRGLIPFTKLKHYEVLPSQVHIQPKLVGSDKTIENYLRGSPASSDSDAPRENFFSAASTAMSVSFWRLRQSFSQVVQREDLILLKLDGMKDSFQVDAHGYMAPDIRALEKPNLYRR